MLSVGKRSCYSEIMGAGELAGGAVSTSLAAGDEPRELGKDVFVRDCMSRSALEDVAGKWPALVLMALLEDRFRFNALRRRIDGVSEKMLAQTVQVLERDGMVSRTVITAIPPRVEYVLTPLGERIGRQVRALADLLEETAEEVRASRVAYDSRTAG